MFGMPNPLACIALVAVHMQNMSALRAALEEALGAEAAAEYTPEDLDALERAGYTGKRRLQSATRQGLERSGLKPALVDELLNAFAGEQAASIQSAVACNQQTLGILHKSSSTSSCYCMQC
jgi:DNA-binding GntR family transcriptional regulator